MKTLIALALLCLISFTALADVQICITVSDDEAAYLTTKTNDANSTVEAVVTATTKRSADIAKKQANALHAEKLNAADKATADAAKAAADVELEKPK